ncbi:MAG: TolB-like translocation protein [Ktedonobacteraceae bacterium]
MYQMRHIGQRCYGFCALCCLLVLLNACGQSSGNGVSSTSSSTKTILSPTATIASTTVKAQTCPAQASARVVSMPSIPVTVGNHATIVYLAQQGNENSMLQRYDTVTRMSQTILQTQGAETLQTANMSPDGQWILLVSLLQGQSAIQLVRMDGQHLQTVYCAPAQSSIDNALLSPDQHFIVFNQEDENEISILYLLDLTTGKLRTEVSLLQPNFPGAITSLQTSHLSHTASPSLQNRADHNLETQRFEPIPSTHDLIYIPMKWANNSIYLLGTMHASPAPLPQLALLRNISKDVSQQQSNVQTFSTTTAPDGNSCFDYDVTPDNRQMLCSAYALMGPTSPTTITLQPITGGAPHLVYSNPTGGTIVARAITNSTILFILNKPNGPPALWKINTNGSGLTQLMTAKNSDTGIGFAYSSYLPSSIISHDGTLYALEVSSTTGNTQSLIFGSLNGGLPTTFASNTNALLLVGWTAYA